ncbi:hypothetical protein [Streptomyces sp. NPDC048577]|uniref:DUF6907 domain-containing protein n=1 Tax=Streptomyces sp. NPDC048577 TaxID=3157209 RepID=UPI0034314C6C
MSDRNPLEGIDPDRLTWHQGALDGDAGVCGAPQPMQPGYPCVWSKGFHERHQDVYGRTWRDEESLRVTRRAPVVDGMVTVDTGDHGPVQVAEPAWCVGQHPAVACRVDITHESEEIFPLIPTLCHGETPTLLVSLAQRPFSSCRGQVVAVMHLAGWLPAGEWHELDSTGLDLAAARLVEHAAELRHLARKLAALEVGEQ